MDTAVSAMLDMLVLDMLDMLATPMPMVLTLMPMVPTTLERGRLRLSQRLMLMPLFSMVATVPTWDKKFSFPPSFAQFNHNRIQTIYLRKR